MQEIIAVVTITILAVISPGPDFAMVSRNSLLVSRSCGLWTAAGIGAGVLVHVGYTIIGVGLLIASSVWLFNLVKLAGAAYLIWLGVGMLRAPAGPVDADPQAPLAMSAVAALRTGFLTNVLNPKTTIFIVSLYTQVVHAGTSMALQVGYGVFIAAAHIMWFSVVAIFFSAPVVRERFMRARRWVDRVFGGLLVGLGALLASASLQR